MGKMNSACGSRFIGMAEFSNESVSAIEATLGKVERALDRLQSGSFRKCQVCGIEIDASALIKDPTLANCASHPELL
jgi:RNA polymerase-binding transcription factor DksA